MHAVMRQYSGKGAKELLTCSKSERMMSKLSITGIEGFVSSTLIGRVTAAIPSRSTRIRREPTKALSRQKTGFSRTHLTRGRARLKSLKAQSSCMPEQSRKDTELPIFGMVSGHHRRHLLKAVEPARAGL